MPGKPSVAIESMKQAAKRPKPPLPKPGSTSFSIISSKSTFNSERASLAMSYNPSAIMALDKVRPIKNSIDK